MSNEEDRPPREVALEQLRRLDQPRVQDLEPRQAGLPESVMMRMFWEKDEIDLQHLREQQQPVPAKRPFIRSMNNDVKSFVTFLNRTKRGVTVYWIDYKGRAVKYGTLWGGRSLNIDTFVTHPWIFADKRTGDRYVVNHKEVYFPEPHRLDGGGRTRVVITIPVYRLEDVALRVIAPRLSDKDQAYKLDIPKVLQYEVAIRVMKEITSGT